MSSPELIAVKFDEIFYWCRKIILSIERRRAVLQNCSYRTSFDIKLAHPFGSIEILISTELKSAGFW